MSGHRSYSEIREKAGGGPDREVRRAEARAAVMMEIAAYESTLAELRRARGMTQQQLARVLELTQPQVSRVEHRTDVLLSTLRAYVQALGGELVVTAQFSDQGPVEVTFDELLGRQNQTSDK